MAGDDARLHLVTPGADPYGGQSVRAAAGMSRRHLLTALRDKIAADIDEGVAARDLASLSLRLLDVSEELEALAAAEDGDAIGTAAESPDEPYG